MKELVKIQAELKAPKNQRNNFGKYNYRSCEDILEGLKPLLQANECYVTLNDDVVEIGGLLMIKATATITNSKGIAISVVSFAGVDPNKKGMDISQTFGSSSSYARKYALNGLFAIDDTKDADTQAPAKPTTPAPAPAKLTMDYSSTSFINCKNVFLNTPKEGEKLFIDKLKNAYNNAGELIEKLQKIKLANKI
jgi:hypothetical protein